MIKFKPEFLKTKQEKQPKGTAFVVAPGLGGTTGLFENILTQLPHDDSSPQKVYGISTHPEQETKIHDNENYSNNSPIFCAIAPDSKHKTLQGRADLIHNAITEAQRTNPEIIKIIAHSAGGLATLKALADIIKNKKENPDTKLPNIHAVLIAPAISGDTNKVVTATPAFFKVMAKNPKYLFSFLLSRDFAMQDKDIQELLTLTPGSELDKTVRSNLVNISGKELSDLSSYPKSFDSIDPTDWPKEFKITTVVPLDDNWVDEIGGSRMSTGPIKKHAGTNAQTVFVTGGHLPITKDSKELETIMDVINS